MAESNRTSEPIPEIERYLERCRAQQAKRVRVKAPAKLWISFEPVRVTMVERRCGFCRELGHNQRSCPVLKRLARKRR